MVTFLPIWAESEMLALLDIWPVIVGFLSNSCNTLTKYNFALSSGMIIALGKLSLSESVVSAISTDFALGNLFKYFFDAIN